MAIDMIDMRDGEPEEICSQCKCITSYAINAKTCSGDALSYIWQLQENGRWSSAITDSPYTSANHGSSHAWHVNTVSSAESIDNPRGTGHE